jgi:hypothetical protein
MNADPKNVAVNNDLSSLSKKPYSSFAIKRIEDLMLGGYA